MAAILISYASTIHSILNYFTFSNWNGKSFFPCYFPGKKKGGRVLYFLLVYRPANCYIGQPINIGNVISDMSIFTSQFPEMAGMPLDPITILSKLSKVLKFTVSLHN